MLDKSAPLIFIHGFLGSPQDWQPLIKTHFSSFNTYCYTVPGHQFKPLPDAEDVLEAILDELATLIRPGKKAHLIGYSMGGRLALHFKAKYPDRVDKLMALSSHIGLRSEEEKQAKALRDQHTAKQLISQDFDAFLDKWYSTPMFGNLLISDEIRRTRMNHDRYALTQIMLALSTARLPSLWNQAPSFFEKCLFFFGKNDVEYMKLAKQLAHEKRALIHVIEKAYHALAIEAPDLCATHIKQFITEAHYELCSCDKNT